MEKNKKKKLIKKILILFLFIILLLAFFYFFPFFLVINSKFIIKKFFNRNLIIKSYYFDPVKYKIEINGLILKDNNNLELISLNKLIFNIDLKKLLLARPTISYLYINSPKTYIIKNKNNYSIPEFLEFKTNNNNNKFKFNFPFSIEHIEITDGTLNIKENNKIKSFISKINIYLPGINFSNNQELTPIIKAKLNNIDFNLKGKTIINKDSVINKFNIIFENINLTEFKDTLPEINKIKIYSGNAKLNLNLSFSTYKNKKPSLNLNGIINFKNLFLLDLKLNNFFLEDFSGIINIKNFDIFNNILHLENVKLSKGKINIYYSKNQSENSGVIIEKKSNLKSDFKFKNDFLVANNIEFIFYDKINNQIYESYNYHLETKNFTNYENNNIDFKLKTKLKNIVDLIETEGYLNFITNKYIFNKFLITNFNFTSINIIKNKIKEFENMIVKSFNGKISIFDNNIIVSDTLIELENIIIKNKNNLFKINNLSSNISQFNYLNKNLSIKFLNFDNGEIYFNDNNNKITNLYFKLLPKEDNYNFYLINKNNINNLNLNEKFLFNNIKLNYQTDKLNLNFKINNLDLQPNITISLDKNVNIDGKINVNFNNLFLQQDDIPVFKFENSLIKFDKVQLSPFLLNLSLINLNSPYIYTTVKEDKKLYLFNIFDLTFNKTDSNNQFDIYKILNIDKINIINGKLYFLDKSIQPDFELDISKLDGEILNYPSFVYPEGKIKLSGLINKRNNIDINLTLKKDSINGTIETNDLLLLQFNPYFQKYLEYSILSGQANINSNFKILNNNFYLDINLILKNLRITELYPSKRVNISKIIPLLENDKGEIKLNFPQISGYWGKFNIDYREIFFNLFYDLINNSTKGFINSFSSNFIKDNDYEIIYFKEGTDELSGNIESLFSDEYLKRFQNKNKYFIIEAYVDKNKDLLKIKEEKLNNKILLYNNFLPEINSIEEKEILIKIYKELLNKEVNEIDNVLLKKIILENIKVSDSDFYALSYKRANKIRDILINNFNVSSSRINIVESNIFSNPYIKGINNSIVIVISGNVKK